MTDSIVTDMANETTKARGSRKTQTGTVVSDKMDKSITVVVQRTVKHPLYDKYLDQIEDEEENQYR